MQDNARGASTYLAGGGGAGEAFFAGVLLLEDVLSLLSLLCSLSGLVAGRATDAKLDSAGSWMEPWLP